MLTRAKVGELYPVDDFNRIVAVTETVMDGMGQSSPVSFGSRQNTLMIQVKNLSETDVPSFGVLRITGRLHDETDAKKQRQSALNGGIELKGEKPNDTEDQTTCITQEAIPKNGIGRAIITGTTAAMINVKNKDHQYAKPVKDDILKLESAESGAWKLLFPFDKTGEQIGYICPAGGTSTSIVADTLQSSVTSTTKGYAASGKTVCYPTMMAGRSLASGAVIFISEVPHQIAPWSVITSSGPYDINGAFAPPVLTPTSDGSKVAVAANPLYGQLVQPTSFTAYINNTTRKTGNVPGEIAITYPVMMDAWVNPVGSDPYTYGTSPVTHIFASGPNEPMVEVSPETLPNNGGKVTLTLKSVIPQAEQSMYTIQYSMVTRGASPGTYRPYASPFDVYPGTNGVDIYTKLVLTDKGGNMGTSTGVLTKTYLPESSP